MLRKSIHIVFALTLILTTTNSIWGHLIADEDSIEIGFESEEEKKEREAEEESSERDHGLVSVFGTRITVLVSGLQKIGSSTFLLSYPEDHLYILYSNLKIDC